MKVADKDEIIHSMLAEEYRRCREVLQALRTKAENLPKGALNVRRKQIKGNEYVYHYLVRREGRKVVNQHVAEKDLPELQKQIEERDKYRKEILTLQQTTWSIWKGLLR